MKKYVGGSFGNENYLPRLRLLRVKNM